jgi:glycosyltransferase involved in cell wall biosynthesis
LKIAFFDDRYPVVYGAQENLLLLAAASQEAGHDVVFITTREGELADAGRARGLTVQVCHAPEALVRFEREALLGGPQQLVWTAITSLRYSLHLDRLLRDTGTDVVVASAVRPCTMLVRTGLRRRPRVILYAQNSTPLGAFAAIAAIMSWRICLIGPGAASTFPRPVLQLLKRRIRFLPSGRRLRHFASIHRSNPFLDGSPARRVLTVASLTSRKGIHLLIDSIARANSLVAPIVKDIDLVVVGGTTGPKSADYLASLQEQAASMNVDVRFEGWQDDVRPYYAQADLFALASEDEGLPGVLLEAMATALPCVTTEAGSAGELVRQCGGGKAVPVGDVTALAEMIALLLTDRVTWEEAASTGRKRVATLYDIDAFLARFEVILGELPRRRRQHRLLPQKQRAIGSETAERERDS